MITNNKEIKGIKLNNKTNLLSQFADDTTLSLDGTEKSLAEAIKTITLFSRYSGLKINEGKTMIIWIGSRKGSNMRYLRDKNYVWDPGRSFRIVGIKFSTNINSISNINFENKLNEIRNIISKWKKRQLTPIGKIAVIKSLLITKITHLLINIPDPDEKFITDLEKEFYQFIWNGKPSRISKNTITNEYNEGGLRMVNVKNFLTALKTSWIRKMKNDSTIKEMINGIYPNFLKLFQYGIEFSKMIYKTVNNPFWRDVLKHFIKVQEKLTPSNIDELKADHIFYNSNILRDHKPIFLKEWADNEILYIYQLQNDQNEFLTFDEFSTRYNCRQTNFIVFNGIINAVRRYKNSFQIPINYTPKLLENKIWHNLRKGNKHIQKILNSKNYTPAAVLKWNRSFEHLNWEKIFSMIYITTNDIQHRWFQYRLIHRILPTQRYLYLTKIVDSPICNLCSEDEQDISHLFFECNIAQLFWGQLETLLKRKCHHCQNVRISKQLVIFGTTENFISDKIFDQIILLAKHYLYICKLEDGFPNIDQFIVRLKNRHKVEKYVAAIENNSERFKTDWLMYNSLLE